MLQRNVYTPYCAKHKSLDRISIRQKAGLVELVDDDRATLLGAFFELAARLQDDEHSEGKPTHLIVRWRRRGLRVFDTDKEASAAKGIQRANGKTGSGASD